MNKHSILKKIVSLTFVAALCVAFKMADVVLPGTLTVYAASGTDNSADGKTLSGNLVLPVGIDTAEDSVAAETENSSGEVSEASEKDDTTGSVSASDAGKTTAVDNTAIPSSKTTGENITNTASDGTDLGDGTNVLAMTPSENQMPIIVLKSYSVTEGRISSGSDFTIEFQYENVNRLTDAYQIYITVFTTVDGITLVDGESNQRYLDYLKVDESGSFSMRFHADENLEAEKAGIEIRFSFVNAVGTGSYTVSDITPDMEKTCSIKLVSVLTSQNPTVNSRSLLNVQYTNDGEAEISDVYMRLSGNIREADTDIDLQVPQEGRQISTDQYIEFTESGHQYVSLVLYYTDTEGRQYETSAKVLSVNVKSAEEAESDTTNEAGTLPGISSADQSSGNTNSSTTTVSADDEEKNPNGLVTVVQMTDSISDNILLILAIAAVVIIIVIVLISIFSHRKRSKRNKRKKQLSGGICLFGYSKRY